MTRLFNTTLGIKFTLGIGLILFLFFGISLIAHIQGRQSIESLKKDTITRMDMAESSQKVQDLLSVCIHHAMRFLLDGNPKQADLFMRRTHELIDELNAMDTMAKTNRHPNIQRLIADILPDIRRYRDAFQGLVSSYDTIGRNDTTGLTGQLRNSIGLLEKDVQAHDLTGLYLAFLHMRSLEKDYVRTWSRHYTPIMIERMENFATELDDLPLTTNRHSAIREGFKEYQAAYERYFSADENKRAIIYEEIRSAAGMMESGIKDMFVPHTQELLLSLQRHEKDVLRQFKPSDVDLTHKALQSLADAFDTAPILKTYKDTIQKRITSYSALFDQRVKARNAMLHDQKQVVEMADRMESVITTLKTHTNSLSRQSIMQTNSEPETIANLPLIMTISAMIISGFIFLLMTRRVSYFFRQSRAYVQSISQGNYDIRLDETKKDDIGRLGSALNILSDRLQTSLKTLDHDAGRLSNTSQSLIDISTHLSQSTPEISQKTDHDLGDSEALSGFLDHVSQWGNEASNRLETLASSIDGTTERAGELDTHVEKTQEVSNRAVERVGLAGRNIHKLNQSARDIHAFIDTIDDISDQTNLLALNATIEAARAGESGKGFAVVAHEIKDLARETAKATHHIRSHIQGIQDTSGQTVEEIDSMALVVDDVADMINQLPTVMQKQSITEQNIIQTITQSADDVNAIKREVEQYARINQNITEKDPSATEISDEYASHGQNVQDVAEELSRLADSLHHTIDLIKRPFPMR